MTADNPTPAPVSTVEEQVAEVLAAHEGWIDNREQWATRRWSCVCGAVLDDNPSGRNITARHRRHIASLIADLNRAAAAEALQSASKALDAQPVTVDGSYGAADYCAEYAVWLRDRADAVAREGEEVGRRG